MQFNSTAVSNLYATVALKRTPYANNLVSVRITADFDPQCSANKSQYIANLPADATLAQVELALTNLQKRANAASVFPRFSPIVVGHLSKNSQ